MKQILIVEASPLTEASASRRVAHTLEEKLRADHPEARIVRRDLAAEPVPHLDAGTVAAMRSKGADEALRLSDALIDEVLGSDLVVIATPMWNFGVPSTLKAWIDHVVRAGKTFAYSEKGPVGLAGGRKAVIIASSGGVYSSGRMQSFDFVVPYLKAVLGFIGLEVVETVRAEGLAVPALAEAGLANAQKGAQALVV